MKISLVNELEKAIIAKLEDKNCSGFIAPSLLFCDKNKESLIKCYIAIEQFIKIPSLNSLLFRTKNIEVVFQGAFVDFVNACQNANSSIELTHKQRACKILKKGNIDYEFQKLWDVFYEYQGVNILDVEYVYYIPC